MDVDIGKFEIRKVKSSRMSQNQFGVMVDFLTLHPELISSSTVNSETFTRRDLRKLWEELADILNSDRTGGQKTVDKWKKCWQDQKVMIKNKVSKMKLQSAVYGSDSQHREILSELEEKAWNLMKSQRSQDCQSCQNDSSENADAVACISPQSVGYVVLNVNGTPLNVLPGQVTGGTSDSLLGSNAMEHSGILSEEAIKKEPVTYVVSEASPASSVVKEVQSSQNTSSSNQPSFIRKKSFEKVPLNINVQNLRSLRRRKEENRIIQLLQRQNKLLECLVGSVSRIEKSLSANNAQRTRRESAIGNIVNNIDKIAGSLGSVSKALKTISEK